MRQLLSALALAACMVAAGAGAAHGAPVSWALTKSADPLQGTTSCRQDDGIGDYPTDLTGEASGCTWRKGVLIPDWIKARLTSLRAYVGTNAYYGDWTVSGLAPDGATRIGTLGVSNRAGNSYSAPLDPNAVIGPGGRASLILAGGPFAGTFASLARSGFEVQFDDSQPPRIEPANLRLPAELRSRQQTPDLTFAIIENGPLVPSAEINWGDGEREQLIVTNPGAAWDGSENTRFELLVPAGRHLYVRDGRFDPTIVIRDGAGNVGTYPIGPIRVGPPPPPPLASVAAPKVRGRAVVGGRLVCDRGRWRGQPTRLAVTWQRQVGRSWTRVGKAARTRTLTRADAGKRIRCSVRAIRAGRGVTAVSAAVRVRAPQ